MAIEAMLNFRLRLAEEAPLKLHADRILECGFDYDARNYLAEVKLRLARPELAWRDNEHADYRISID